MTTKSANVLAAIAIVIFGWGAIILLWIVGAAADGGSWQDILTRAAWYAAPATLIICIALVLRWAGLIKPATPGPGEVPPALRFILAFFFWSVVAPVIFLTALGLWLYPASLLSDIIWPTAKPLAAQLVLGTLAVAAVVFAVSCVIWVWRRMRAVTRGDSTSPPGSHAA